MKHRNKWIIAEVRLKKEFISIAFFVKLMNGVALDKAFILLLAF